MTCTLRVAKLETRNGGLIAQIPGTPHEMTMTALILEQYASVSLAESWRSSYRKAMGLSDVRSSKPGKGSLIRITNLLSLQSRNQQDHDSDSQSGDDRDSEKWMSTAIQIQNNLDEMARWIRQKRPEYCGVYMSDTEASLIQSTIMSFTATTATEIESLRGLISQNETEQRVHHHTSIVQILLGRLKEEVAEPFGKMQKLRTRAAVRLWQHPLECKLFDSNHRFCPTRPSHKLHLDFLSSYETKDVVIEKPKTGIVFGSKPARWTEENSKHLVLENEPDSRPATKRSRLDIDQQREMQMPYQHAHDPQTHSEDQYNMSSTFSVSDELQQEALLLTASLQGELDSVQKMEHMMVDITTLLSQFAELVAEQQENVYDIRDASASAKQNMDSGEEELLKAREKTDQSSHYMAKAIFAMSFSLLFFNWIRA